MMEFLWSRVTLTACGLAVMAVLVSSFSSLDDASRDRAAVDGARELGELLERFPDYGAGASMVIETSRFLPTPEHRLLVTNGSLWTVHGDDRRAVECPARLLLLSGGEAVERLELSYDQSIRVENVAVDGAVVVRVQLEKVATIPLTASTNFLHSVSVL